MKFFDKKVILACLFIVFVITISRYSHHASTREASDFQVTHATSVRFLQKENIYQKFEDTTIANFKYSPMFAFLTMPLGFLPLHQAALVFFTINYLCLIALFIYSKKLIAPDVREPIKVFWLYAVPLIFCFRYLLNCLDAGQINIQMIALATASLYYSEKKKDILAGALLALSIQFKYTTFLFVPYLLLRGRFKTLFWLLIISVVYLFLPAVYLGMENEILYLKGWIPFISQTSLDYGSIVDLKNQSLPSMVLRYLAADTYFGDKIRIASLSKPLAMNISIAIAGVLYLLALLHKKNERKSTLSIIDLSIIFVLVPLLNPNSWTFNYLSLIFPVMALTYYYESGFPTKDKVLLILLSLSFIIGNIGSKSLVGKDLQSLFHTLSFVVFSALFVLATLFYLKVKSSDSV